MAIDAKFFSYDREAVFQLTAVEPGRAYAWSDVGMARYVVALCFDSDLGGTVHLVDEVTIEGTPKTQAFELITAENIEQQLIAGDCFEIDIVDHEGENGRLVLQHRPGGILVNSLN